MEQTLKNSNLFDLLLETPVVKNWEPIKSNPMLQAGEKETSKIPKPFDLLFETPDIKNWGPIESNPMFAKAQAKEEAERKARVAAVQLRIAQEQSNHVLPEKEATH